MSDFAGRNASLPRRVRAVEHPASPQEQHPTVADKIADGQLHTIALWLQKKIGAADGDRTDVVEDIMSIDNLMKLVLFSKGWLH